MRVRIVECDWCLKQADAYAKPPGWVWSRLSIMKNGYQWTREIDACSVSCLIARLEAFRSAAEEQGVRV